MPTERPEISQNTLASWQRVVDLIARMAHVPASLVMRTHAPHHSVLVTSRSAGNPYAVGRRFRLHPGLYCQGVLTRGGELVVEDAQRDPAWQDNDDLEHGMSFYVGFPLRWPDGGVFGTICVLDRRRNRRALLFREGLGEFARVIEADLDRLTEIAARRRAEAALQDMLDRLEATVSDRTHELQEANTALRVLLDNLDTARREHDGQLRQQIRGLVVPHLARLRLRVMHDPAALMALDMAEDSLESITAPMAGRRAALLESLTPAEQEIAQMVLRGQSTKEIARLLGRGPATVEFHRNNIRRKLGLRGKARSLRSVLNSLQ